VGKYKNTQTKKNPWLEFSLVLSVVILIGLSIPWIEGLDFGGRGIGVATVRGWHIKWLPITALIAVGGYLGACLKKEQPTTWLVIGLAGSVGSLIPIINTGILMQTSTSDESLYRNVLIISESPLIGFWVTSIGIVGMIICGVGYFMFKKSSSP